MAEEEENSGGNKRSKKRVQKGLKMWHDTCLISLSRALRLAFVVFFPS